MPLPEKDYENPVIIGPVKTCKREQCGNKPDGDSKYCSRQCWMADNPDKAL